MHSGECQILCEAFLIFGSQKQGFGVLFRYKNGIGLRICTNSRFASVTARVTIFSVTHFCIIFDLNGTLVDTESAYFLAYKDALEIYDIAFTIEQFTENWPRRGKKLRE